MKSKFRWNYDAWNWYWIKQTSFFVTQEKFISEQLAINSKPKIFVYIFFYFIFFILYFFYILYFLISYIFFAFFTFSLHCMFLTLCFC